MAYKIRPAPNKLPGKKKTGAQNHEGIAGVLGAIEYLLAKTLAEQGIYAWDGNYYALAVAERLGVEESGPSLCSG